MKTTSSEQLVREWFAATDVAVNGSRPWDMQVRHGQLYKRLVAGGSMALGESYMDGWWDCEALDQFFDRILKSRLDQKAGKSIKAWWCRLIAACTCSPGYLRAFEIGKRHYDLGNDLFRLMLDKWMYAISLLRFKLGPLPNLLWFTHCKLIKQGDLIMRSLSRVQSNSFLFIRVNPIPMKFISTTYNVCVMQPITIISTAIS